MSDCLIDGSRMIGFKCCPKLSQGKRGVVLIILHTHTHTQTNLCLLRFELVFGSFSLSFPILSCSLLQGSGEVGSREWVQAIVVIVIVIAVYSCPPTCLPLINFIINIITNIVIMIIIMSYLCFTHAFLPPAKSKIRKEIKTK